jgi:hypothetical protein
MCLLFVPGVAAAATLDELKKYDRNGNNRIDADEIGVYALHRAKPMLAKYDTLRIDGKLDNEELALLRADLESVPAEDPKFLVDVGYLQDEASRKSGIPFRDLAEQKPAPSSGKADACDDGQGLYIRRDRMDISVYNNSLDKSGAKGASITYTDNRLTDSEIAEIHGAASYVIARDPCAKRPQDAAVSDRYLSGYATALWTSLDGTLSDNRAKEKSAAKIGFDAQAEFAGGPLFNLQYLTLSPYYQSDFRGEASAYGATASWQPFLLDARLGGSYQQLSPWFDFFWQLTGEADVLHVSDVGLTSLKAGADYAWLGATVRLNMFPLADLLDYRLSLTVVYNYYWDAKANDDIWFVTPAIAYNIAADGSTSVSLEYKKGTEKATLTERDEYVASLNYKF